MVCAHSRYRNTRCAKIHRHHWGRHSGTFYAVITSHEATCRRFKSSQVLLHVQVSTSIFAQPSSSLNTTTYIRQVWDPWEIDGGIVTIFPTLFLSYVNVYLHFFGHLFFILVLLIYDYSSTVCLLRHLFMHCSCAYSCAYSCTALLYSI